MILHLENYEAEELANWLDGTDAHLSVGDRLFLARRIRTELEKTKE
jgi:hypothetical protein